MSRLDRTLLFALFLVVVVLANPKRGDTWTCPDCQAENDEGRSYCMNGCGASGPLAPPRPPRPAGGN